MALPPQKFREIVFQLIYSADLGYSEEKEIFSLLMQELEVSKKNVLIAQEKVKKLLAHQDELDEIIRKTTLSYEFERIQSVERNILRLGVYELLFEPDLAPAIVISEAVRLAKKFGSPESASFVNAILDAISKSSKGEEVNADSVEEQSKALRRSEEMIAELPKEIIADDFTKH